MWRLRPIKTTDTPALISIINDSGLLVSSLPKDLKPLANLVLISEQSFNQPSDGFGSSQQFLWVLEHTPTQTVVGCCGLNPYAGLDQPFYNYRVDELIHASDQLNIHNRNQVLIMSHHLTGSINLKSLILSSSLGDFCQTDQSVALLKKQLQQFMLKSRIMFCLLNESFLDKQILAEIPGETQLKENRLHSDFWQEVGQLFFGMDYHDADLLCAEQSKTFIAELMPHHPIYAALLSQKVKENLGSPNKKLTGIIDNLISEGFKKSEYIDIFDAGPTYLARIKDLSVYSQTSLINKENFDAFIQEDFNRIISNAQINRFTTELIYQGQRFNPKQLTSAQICPMVDIT